MVTEMRFFSIPIVVPSVGLLFRDAMQCNSLIKFTDYTYQNIDAERHNDSGNKKVSHCQTDDEIVGNVP